jgi:hypothetical protein
MRKPSNISHKKRKKSNSNPRRAVSRIKETDEATRINLRRRPEAAPLPARHHPSRSGRAARNLRGRAEEELKHGANFDYLHGRVMKVDLSGDSFDPWLYDRDNGEGAASRAIAKMRPTPTSPTASQ